MRCSAHLCAGTAEMIRISKFLFNKRDEEVDV